MEIGCKLAASLQCKLAASLICELVFKLVTSLQGSKNANELICQPIKNRGNIFSGLTFCKLASLHASLLQACCELACKLVAELASLQIVRPEQIFPLFLIG